MIACLAEGLTDAEVAERLGVQPRTVAKHIRRIGWRAGLTDRLQLMSWATRMPGLGVGQPDARR